MSESQLKKQLAENQTLTQQLERSKSIIKTSVACQEMVEYVTKQPDPFIPGYSGNDNPWHTTPNGSICVVI